MKLGRQCGNGARKAVWEWGYEGSVGMGLGRQYERNRQEPAPSVAKQQATSHPRAPVSHRESRLNMSPNFMHGLAVECSQQMKLVS